VDDQGSTVGRAGIFSPHHFQTSSGAHPTSYMVGTGILSLGVKWPGCEADHLPSSGAKVKNARSYTSTTPHVFMAWCLGIGTT